ncbi:MAG: hypothetical protein ACP5FK_05135 [bacterium]
MEEVMGETAIETVDLAKERMVKNNMRLLQLSIEEFALEQQGGGAYPSSISEIDLPNASNPYSNSNPAFVDGSPTEQGQVGYIGDGNSYQILGYGSNSLLDFKLSKP